MRPICAATLTILLASCAKSSGGTPTGTLLEPPPGTGELAIEMRGTWRVAAVEVLDEVVPDPNALPPYVPFGLLRPVVDDVITIDERGFIAGAGRPLLREVCDAGGSVVGEYYNQVTGSVALYNMECHSRPDPGIADGGALRFRMAFGATSQDALLGVIDFRLSAFVPASTPLSGTYRVMLVRDP